MKPRGSPGAPLITVISSIPSAGATNVSYECIVLNALSGPNRLLVHENAYYRTKIPFRVLP